MDELHQQLAIARDDLVTNQADREEQEEKDVPAKHEDDMRLMSRINGEDLMRTVGDERKKKKVNAETESKS